MILRFARRSLIGRVPAYKVQTMLSRILGRKTAAIVIALGVFLGGVGPSWAVPATSGEDSTLGIAMTMVGMPMPCAEMMGGSSPAEQMPLKWGDKSCAVCIACAVNVGAPQGFSPVTLLLHGEARTVSREENRNDIASPPPLPPPILRI